jgi:hypothetical protein
MPTAAARPEGEPQPRVQPNVGYGLLAVCSAEKVKVAVVVAP